MHLILTGNAKTHQSTTEGYYLLAANNSNGYPYWKQINGDYAIWFQISSHTGWTVGDRDFLGQDYSGAIIGPNDFTVWPNMISDVYHYWDGSNYQKASTSEIVFQECKLYVEK